MIKSSGAPRCGLKHQKGLSFLEILIAGTIVAIVGAAFYATFINAARYTQPQRQVAFNVAQTQLESRIANNWGADNWTNASFSNVSPAVGLTTYTNANSAGAVTQTGDIVSGNNGTSDIKNYRKVTITTSWT